MTPQQNDTLCRVERAAPMGALMRRYWLPACLSEDVAEPDGPPRRARLLGVNLVVFRDTAGRVGVLDELCPHRRASLVYGRNEDCGLRCLYHGWKFDVTGAVTEMPSEPAGTALTEKIAARAYPAVESGGFVWVWLGDPDAVTPFDPPIWAKAAPGNVAVVKVHADCNWAQVLEGSIDSAHSSSLHSTNMPTADSVASSTATDTAWLRPSADKSPRLDVQRLDLGFRYAAIRTPIHDPDLRDYIRVTVFQAPFTVHIPPTDQYRLSQMLVPIDDENTMFYWIAWHTDPAKGIAQDDWRRFCGAEVGKDVEALAVMVTTPASLGWLASAGGALRHRRARGPKVQPWAEARAGKDLRMGNPEMNANKARRPCKAQRWRRVAISVQGRRAARRQRGAGGAGNVCGGQCLQRMGQGAGRLEPMCLRYGRGDHWCAQRAVHAGRRLSGLAVFAIHHHLHAAHGAADHLARDRFDHGRGDGRADEQGKPHQHKAGDPAGLAQGLQGGHGGGLSHRTFSAPGSRP